MPNPDLVDTIGHLAGAVGDTFDRSDPGDPCTQLLRAKPRASHPPHAGNRHNSARP